LLKGLHIAILAIDKVIREGFRDIKLYAFGTEKSLILKGMIKTWFRKQCKNYYLRLVERPYTDLFNTKLTSL